MNKPLTGGDFDPLLPPGGASGFTSNQAGFQGGDLVRAVMDNTAFFKVLPKGEADADKLLVRGTGMKVIRVAGSYLQVELDVTGEVGFVPAVMVESASTPPADALPLPGQYQVYPPLPGAMPPLDPAGLPPGGTIPTVIDPSLPATPGAVPTPPVDPTQPGVAPAPPAPPAVPEKPAVPENLPENPVPPVEPTDAPPTGEAPAKPADTP